MNRLLVMLALVLTSAVPARAQDAPSGPPPTIGVLDLEARLAALSADEPMAYFELAEEVAAEIRDGAGRELAKRLYVLAYELSRDSPRAPRLTRSVCLALAALEESGTERYRWLNALASLQSDDASSASMVETLDARETIAIALSFHKAEDNLKARIQFGRPNVARYIASLSGTPRQLIETVLADIQAEASCLVCRNRRVTRDRNANSPDAPDVLCTRCSGNPGPRLTAQEYLDLLLFEIDLLDVEAPTWSAQLDLDNGDPLREADPDQLAPLYGFDAGATMFRPSATDGWRNGTWIEPDRIDGDAPELTQPGS